MLPLFLLAAPAGFAQLAAAVAFAGPAPTPRGDLHQKRAVDARAPKPTDGPLLLLRADQNSNTCGWDKDGVDITCETGSCVYYEPTGTVAGMAGCCTSDDYQNCGWGRTCYDYAAISTSSLCDSACWQNSFAWRCTEKSAPYCQSWSYPGANVKDFGCGTDGASTFTSLYSTSVGSESGATSTVTNINQVISGREVTGWQNTPVASSSKGTKTGTQEPVKATSGPSVSPTSVEHNSSHTGAIAGGAAAGGIVIIALAAAVFFLYRRNRQHAKASQTQYTQVPGGSGGSPPAYMGGPYDTKAAGVIEMDGDRHLVEAGGMPIYKKEAPVGTPPPLPYQDKSKNPAPQEVHELQAATGTRPVYEMES